ncbi:unnamed protein product, partial [Staurois parvus]
LKRSSTQKGKFHFKDCSPLRIGTFGERVPEFDRYPLPLLVIGNGRCPPSL